MNIVLMIYSNIMWKYSTINGGVGNNSIYQTEYPTHFDLSDIHDYGYLAYNIDENKYSK